jgi:hypothetical protein
MRGRLRTGRPPRDLSRRRFLGVGTLGGLGLGLSLPGWLAASRAAPGSGPGCFGKARRCILLFPFGGPSQIDTFDPKPEAPSAIRGEFQPIATSLPGVQFSELLPGFARRADRLCLIRSVSHTDTVHTSAGYTMLTGVPHRLANTTTAALIHPSPDDHPNIGAILARVRPSRHGLPTAVQMPEVVKDAGVNELPGQDAGFLGRQYAPFLHQADTKAGTFTPPEIGLPEGITARRLDARRHLLGQVESRLAALESSGQAGLLDAHAERAYTLLRSPEARQAFELDREPRRVRESYGEHLFGQGCLLARRLVEAGVGLVTVYWHYEGPEDSPSWDTHENNFRHLRQRLAPPADRAFSALLDDLDARGLLDDTLVVWMGEFGRSPRINPKAGREHWPHVQSVILAGAGVRPGFVHGASDRIGAYPADAPVSPADLHATLLHLLGVPLDREFRDRLQRPYPVTLGTPLASLLG